MKVLLLACFCISLALCDYAPEHDIKRRSSDVVPSKGQPWPLPQQYTPEVTYFSIQPENFQFLLSRLPRCDILVDAIQRCQNISFTKGCSREDRWRRTKRNVFDNNYKGQLLNLTIIVAGSCEKYPYMDMDELYRLKIDDPDAPNEAMLVSSTVWGALRGLETFSQLIYEITPGKFAINSTSILDFPRFSFRGLLLDTSRHFIPVPILLQNLDIMGHSKLNVFHWHIVDDQSFPFVSRLFPDLSKKGAFDAKTHVYSPEDVENVIEYARLRGIRVLPEFDTPGHTLSWGKSNPDILTQCYAGSQPIPDKYGPIDPTKNSTFTFVQELFSEIGAVFPDSYIHLGGDEVSFDCWKSNPKILEFMTKHGFGNDFSKLEEYYMQNLLDIVQKLGKSYIVWQEVFDNRVQVKKDTVIHVWKEDHKVELKKVTGAGYKSILSSCWYLNYISYGQDWPQYYNCDPHAFRGNATQKKLVIGGEACMWGEYVDGSNLITRTWPRAAVVAERLWSDKNVRSVNDAIPRLEEFRCRMIKRGLKVEPVSGPGYCDCDYMY